MVKRKSLVKIAYEAEFYNLHDRGTQVLHLGGSIISEKFELIYLKPLNNMEDVEVLGVEDPFNYKTCALYRLKREKLDKWIGGNGNCYPGAGGINLDKEGPLFNGDMAVRVLIDYAKLKKR